MAGKEGKPAIRWDDSRGETLHAKSCTVAGSREEMYLLFGPEQPGGDVSFTKRIILSPFTARQFSAALERVLRDYETKFGPLEQSAPGPTREERSRKGPSLFELVKGLEVSIGYEQSFKMLDRTILANRFLLGVSKREIAFKANDRIIAVCERMSMPASLMEVFRQCLFDVQYVHFGFEEDRDSCLYKVYVEFWDSISKELERTDNYARPYILHLGFKWDPFNPGRKAVTRYTWYPRLTAKQIMDRVSAIADPGRHRHISETVGELLKVALERMPYQDVIYLEVTEQGNPRKSFDINVYRGGLQVGELYGLLARLGRHYRIPRPDFHRLYDSFKVNTFGHLSGGTSRDEKDFCTVYHGVEPIGGRSQAKGPHRFMGPSGGAQSGAGRPVEETDEQAALLVELLGKLNVPVGFERSFKIASETFLPGRFLAGFQIKVIAAEYYERQARVVDICRQVNMPEDFLGDFEEDLSSANIALFGFEKNGEQRLYKAYLEFTGRLGDAFAADPDNPLPFLLFMGFKWDIADPSRRVLTRYTCFPSFILQDMWQKAAGLFSPDSGKDAARALGGILDLASHRAGPGDFLYLEADEPASGRKSFDINIYKAGLTVAEIYPLLVDMARHFHIGTGEFLRAYETAKPQVLGHVAGGIDREGRDFLTLYYEDREKSKGGPGWERLGQWTGKRDNGPR